MVKVTNKLSYDPKKELGVGLDGGMVFEGVFDSRPVAVKRIDSEKIKLGEREKAALLRGDKHDNIVKYFCTEEYQEFICIALEICDFDLSKYFSDSRANVLLRKLQDEFKVIDIMKQTTKGLKFLHEKGIIHRDIKPQNILVQQQTDGGEWKVKISDFGVAKILQANKSQTNMTNPNSTSQCAALEVLNGRTTSKMSDVYSLGCFFFFMLSGGFYPFDVNELNEHHTKTETAAYNDFINVNTDERILALNLIEKMLNDDQNQRPIVETIEYHPTFWDFQEKMKFLTDVVMLMRVKNDPNVPIFVAALEANKSQVFTGNWADRLDSVLQKDVRVKNLKYPSFESLIWYIRNKKTHFVEEKVKAIKDVFGCSEDDVIVYFIELFPRLIINVLDVVVENINIFNVDFKDQHLKYYMQDSEKGIPEIILNSDLSPTTSKRLKRS